MVSINNLTRQPIPRLPFSKITDKVLGSKYDLSLVFVGHKRSRDLNFKFRQKDRPTNVLSFPYDKKTGEMFIDLQKVKEEHEKFDRDFKNHVGALFIHGVLHLKGLDHGSTMDRKETNLIKAFLNEKKNSHRSRHRHVVDSRRRVRI